MGSPSQWLAAWLIRWRYALLIVAVAVAVVAWGPSQRLAFDRSIENMFAADDPLLPPYQKLKRTFGGNEVVLLVYRDERLMAEDGAGLERLEQLGDRVKRIAGVKEILSLAELNRSLGSVLRGGILSRDSRIAARVRDTFAGYTHSTDGTTAGIVCILEPDVEGRSRRETIAALRELIDRLPADFPQVMMAGEPVMVEEGFRHIEADGRRLGIASTVLLALVIVLCFRSLRWVLVPIVVVQLALLVTRATLVWSGLRLSMVSSMLTAIVTVVGVATVVHVIVRYRQYRMAGDVPREAMRRAAAWLVVPVFWACATDAAGFASLLVTDVGPVRDFGLMMAIGSLMVLLAAMLAVPGLGLLAARRERGPGGEWEPLSAGGAAGVASRWLWAEPQRAWREAWLEAQLRRLIRWVQKAPWAIATIGAVVALVGVGGVRRVEVESDFTRNFRPHSDIVRSYRFIESRLGGAGVWDVVLPAPEQLDWAYLSRVLRLERRLRDEVVVANERGEQSPGLTKVISIADLVVAASPFDLERATLLRSTAIRLSLSLMQQSLPAFMEALYGRDPDDGRFYFRVMLRARERQSSAAKRRIIEQVERICREEFPPSEQQAGAEVTGFFVLLASLIDSLIRDQWRAFAVASGCIAGMMLLALWLSDPRLVRAIRGGRVWDAGRVAVVDVVTAIVMLIPNALPIVLVMGGMGWLGMKINMGAAMIAAVSIGLSIDSSIHYVTSVPSRGGGRGKCV